MANESQYVAIGNLTADPELRYTNGGIPVANFTIAQTPRERDKETGEFKDGDPLFLRASIWREYAENAAASLTKGQQVIAVGRLKQRSYETKEGEKRTVIELEVDEIGPALRFGEATFARRAKGQVTSAVPTATAPAAAAPAAAAPVAAAVAAPVAAAPVAAAPVAAAPVAAPVAVAAPAAAYSDDDDF